MAVRSGVGDSNSQELLQEFLARKHQPASCLGAVPASLNVLARSTPKPSRAKQVFSPATVSDVVERIEAPEISLDLRKWAPCLRTAVGTDKWRIPN